MLIDNKELQNRPQEDDYLTKTALIYKSVIFYKKINWFKLWFKSKWFKSANPGYIGSSEGNFRLMCMGLSLQRSAFLCNLNDVNLPKKTWYILVHYIDSWVLVFCFFCNPWKSQKSLWSCVPLYHKSFTQVCWNKGVTLVYLYHGDSLDTFEDKNQSG